MALPFANKYFTQYCSQVCILCCANVVACCCALELETFNQNKIYIINLGNNPYSFETTVRLQP